jgi:hypothetical protein
MTYEQADVSTRCIYSGVGMFVKPNAEQSMDVPLVDGGLPFLGDEEVQIGPRELTEEQKEERRELRCGRCGSFLGRRIKPKKGTLGAFPFVCNLWRDARCLLCFGTRLRWVRGRILHAIVKFKKEGGVRVLLSDYNKVREATKELERSDYLRLPIDDDEVILFVRGSESDAGTEMTYEDAVKMDWPKYINTPRNKRISGGLGRNAEIECEGEDEDMKKKKVAIYVPVFSPGDGVTHEDELEAWGKAVEVTSHLDPHTAEELQEALDERMKAFERAIEEAGGSLDRGKTGVEKTYVDLTGIAWQRPYQLNMEEARRELEKDEGIPF